MIAQKTFTTRLHPCAIDCFTAIEGPADKANYIVCGCYELDETTQHRDGSIVLYKSSNTNVEFPVEEVDAISCSSGVLDLKATSKHVFAALAGETLAIHNINSAATAAEHEASIVNHSPVLELKSEGDGLFLALDYSRKANASDHAELTEYVQHLAVSTQSGSIIVYTAGESGYEEVNRMVDAHNMMGESMPVWTVGFNPHDHSSEAGASNLLFSGGDDCAFRLWDLRSPERAYYCNKSAHSAGVTSVAYHFQHEHIMTTGSYDESSITWDLRAMRQPLLRIETGGGVWRTKWITPRNNTGNSASKFDYLCTANMQGGSHVFMIDIDTASQLSVQLQEEHTVKYTDNKEKHLSYGIGMLDYKVNEDKGEINFQIGSCSFYDNVVDLWTATLPFSTA